MRAFVFLGVCLAGIGVTGLRLESATHRDGGWLVLGAVCVAATVYGARANGVWDRGAWRLVALGEALVAGGAGADLASQLLKLGWSFPAPIAPPYIAGCAAVGVGRLVRPRLAEPAR